MVKTMKIASTLAVCLLLVSTFGCVSWARQIRHSHHYHRSVRTAATVKMNQIGNVTGFILLTQKERGVKLSGYIMGLTPGKHGLHVHTSGDVTSDGCNSTGTHYNPHNAPHGGPMNGIDQRHVGDLGNVFADENGVAMVMIFDNVISLTGPQSICGRAIVVHAKEDDLTAKANPGARLACGTILKVNSKTVLKNRAYFN